MTMAHCCEGMWVRLYLERRDMQHRYSDCREAEPSERASQCKRCLLGLYLIWVRRMGDHFGMDLKAAQAQVKERLQMDGLLKHGDPETEW